MACNTRDPEKAKRIQVMDIETLLIYAELHISMDSQDLIDELAFRLKSRIKPERSKTTKTISVG